MKTRLGGVCALISCLTWLTAHAGPSSMVEKVQVVPGQLAVSVYRHTLPPSVPCWTYVSDGLWKLGQKELVFTVERREKETAFPRELLEFYAVVHRLAGEHRLVDAGDVTELAKDASPLLDGSELRGVVYTAPQELEGIHVEAPHLTAILVTAAEMEATAAFGTSRLLSRLGERYRYYPVPPFADRGRPTLMTVAESDQSMLGKVPRLGIPKAVVFQQEQRVVLELTRQQAARLQEQLPSLPLESPLALLTGLDPHATKALVWKPGQHGPAAINNERVAGTHLGGSFVVFVPQQKEDGAQIFEDGFVLYLRDASWKTLRQAILDGKPLTLPGAADKLGFELAWPGSGPVVLAQIKLLTPEDEIAKQISVPAVSGFVKAVEAALASELAPMGKKPGQDLTIRCQLSPQKAEYWLEGGEDPMMQRLYARLVKLNPPKTVSGPVKLSLLFHLWGGR